MCYNCGCHMPQDDMGSADNITDQTLSDLAKKWDKSLPETKETLLTLLETPNSKLEPFMEEMFSKAAKAWGQSVEEAKKNTLNLLKTEVKK